MQANCIAEVTTRYITTLKLKRTATIGLLAAEAKNTLYLGIYSKSRVAMFQHSVRRARTRYKWKRKGANLKRGECETLRALIDVKAMYFILLKAQGKRARGRGMLITLH